MFDFNFLVSLFEALGPLVLAIQAFLSGLFGITSFLALFGS